MSDADNKSLAGRPCKLNDRVAEKIIELCEEGRTDTEIADIIGVTPRTIWLWKKKNVELAQSMRTAKLDADQLVEAALLQKALGRQGMPPDTTACIFWLKNRRPESWRDKQPTDGPDTAIQVNNNVVASDEQLINLVKLARGESK